MHTDADWGNVCCDTAEPTEGLELRVVDGGWSLETAGAKSFEVVNYAGAQPTPQPVRLLIDRKAVFFALLCEAPSGPIVLVQVRA